MSVKLKISLGLGIIILIGAGFFLIPKQIKEEAKNLGATILFPSGGGTGKSTATTSEEGYALVVSSTNPLVYKFASMAYAGAVFIDNLSAKTTDGNGFVTSTHNLNLSHPIVQLWNGNILINNNIYPPDGVYAYIQIIDNNNVRVDYNNIATLLGVNLTTLYLTVGGGGPQGPAGPGVSTSTTNYFTYYNGTNSVTGTSLAQLLEKGVVITTNTYFGYVSSTVLDSVTGTFHALKADGSDGLLINANNGTNVAILGAGNSSNSLFYGGATINGLLTYGSATGVSLTSTNIWATSKIAINSSSPKAQLAITGFDGQSPLAITSSTGSSVLHILANGNVGIGTASPSTKLDVILTNATAKFHDGLTAGGLWTVGNGVIGLGNVAYYTTNGGQNLILATGGTRDSFTVGTARLTVLAANGNIGIGTTTPLGRLVVQGSGTSSPFTVVSSTAVGSMFTILANGNIGINSSTPIDDLAVSGSATTTFILDSTSATQGSCEMRKDSDGSGYTYITYNNGVQTISTTSCR